ASGTPLGIKYQTAGWAFQILPFIEQDNLYTRSDLLKDESGKALNIFPPDYPTTDLAATTRGTFPPGRYNIDIFKGVGPVRRTPVATYYCPARRPVGVYNGVATIDYAAAHPDKVPLPRDPGGKYLGDPEGTLLMTNPSG